MAIAYVSLGSNKGDRIKSLSRAKELISARFGDIICSSGVYETTSWGFDSDNFINQILKIETHFEPVQLLSLCLETEHELGRIRDNTGGYASRTIDIDILFYDDMIVKQDNLKIPHPRLHERLFILVPMNEIAPDYLHPVIKKSIKELLESCADTGQIHRIKNDYPSSSISV